jgi:pimeloyl-ACP methyl ester carboxylesterase
MSRYAWRIVLACLFAAVPRVCGAQAAATADTAIRPFTIRVPDAVLADLKGRLRNPCYPDALQGDGWTYGTDIACLKQLVYESRHAVPAPGGPRRIETPTACADFPREIIWSPRRWLEARYNITRWTVMPRGGHFAAFEQPDLLVDDVRAFFRTVR